MLYALMFSIIALVPFVQSQEVKTKSEVELLKKCTKKSSETCKELGLLNLKANKLIEAEKNFKQACENTSECITLAMLYEDTGRLKESSEVLKKSCDNENDYKYCYSLNILEAKLGNKEDADRYLRKACKMKYEAEVCKASGIANTNVSVNARAYIEKRRCKEDKCSERDKDIANIADALVAVTELRENCYNDEKYSCFILANILKEYKSDVNGIGKILIAELNQRNEATDYKVLYQKSCDLKYRVACVTLKKLK